MRGTGEREEAAYLGKQAFAEGVVFAADRQVHQRPGLEGRVVVVEEAHGLFPAVRPDERARLRQVENIHAAARLGVEVLRHGVRGRVRVSTQQKKSGEHRRDGPGSRKNSFYRMHRHLQRVGQVVLLFIQRHGMTEKKIS